MIANLRRADMMTSGVGLASTFCRASFPVVLLSALLLFGGCESKAAREERLIDEAREVYSAEDIPEGYVSVLVYDSRNFGPWQLEAPFVLLLPRRMVYWTDSHDYFIAYDVNQDVDTMFEDSFAAPPNAMGFLFYDKETSNGFNIFVTTANYLESRHLSGEEKEAYADIMESEVNLEDFGPHAATRDTIEVNGFSGTYVHKLLPAHRSTEKAIVELWSSESFGAILSNDRLIFKFEYAGPPVERTPEEIEAALGEALTVLRSIRFME